MTVNNNFSLARWYDQRPLRERILLLVCVVSVLLVLINYLLLQPFSRQLHHARSELTELKNKQVELQARLSVAAARRDSDPDRENRTRLQLLQQESERLHQQLAESIANLVAPRDMAALLKQVLTRQEGLKFVSLGNLAPERIMPAGKETGGEGLDAVIFRHPLRLEFDGDFLTLLRYLHQLEQLPRDLAWDEIDIETRDYPTARVRIQVHTLSLTEGWIGG